MAGVHHQIGDLPDHTLAKFHHFFGGLAISVAGPLISVGGRIFAPDNGGQGIHLVRTQSARAIQHHRLAAFPAFVPKVVVRHPEGFL
jgi:hypothetical protein